MCTEFNLQLIFKNVRRNKKAYPNYKSGKIPEADSAPVKDLKMELLVKIFNDFILCTIFAKRSILYVPTYTKALAHLKQFQIKITFTKSISGVVLKLVKIKNQDKQFWA